jgi:hypothetical protein
VTAGSGFDVTVRVDGARRLRAELRKLKGNADDLKAANAAAAALVAEAAAMRAPRRTGRLAASVRGNRAVGRAQVRAGGAALPYAGPIHYGWPAHRIEPHPFITDAAQDTEAVWLPMYEAALSRAVDAVAGHY